MKDQFCDLGFAHSLQDQISSLQGDVSLMIRVPDFQELCFRVEALEVNNWHLREQIAELNAFIRNNIVHIPDDINLADLI